MTIGAVDVAPTSGDGTTGIDPHALIKLHPEYAASLPRASGGDNRRSEYARDVLGKVPHWTQRWGLGVLLAFFVLLVLLAWVVRYPDVLVGRGVLLSPNPPAPILARTSGRIATLVVTDRQSVEAGERLAVIESVSDIDEMDRLSHWLDRLTDTPAVAELAGAR